MKRLRWPLLWTTLIALAVYAFADAVDRTERRNSKARADCAQQNGEMIDYGRYTLCRVKGDAR